MPETMKLPPGASLVDSGAMPLPPGASLVTDQQTQPQGSALYRGYHSMMSALGEDDWSTVRRLVGGGLDPVGDIQKVKSVIQKIEALPNEVKSDFQNLTKPGLVNKGEAALDLFEKANPVLPSTQPMRQNIRKTVEQAQSGDVAGAVGTGIGTVAPLVAPELIERGTGVTVPPGPKIPLKALLTDPDIVGVVSPRAANALRLAEKIRKARQVFAEKTAAANAPAPESTNPVPSSATEPMAAPQTPTATPEPSTVPDTGIPAEERPWAGNTGATGSTPLVRKMPWESDADFARRDLYENAKRAFRQQRADQTAETPKWQQTANFKAEQAAQKAYQDTLDQAAKENAWQSLRGGPGKPQTQNTAPRTTAPEDLEATLKQSLAEQLKKKGQKSFEAAKNNPEFTPTTPKEPLAGFTRVYQGEGAAGGGGSDPRFFTTDIGRAKTYGKNISYLDIPNEKLAEFKAAAKKAGSGTGSDVYLPYELVKTAKPHK